MTFASLALYYHMKKRLMNIKKRNKLIENVRFFLQTDSTTTTRGLLYQLRSSLRSAKYVEDLKPEEIRALSFLGKWRYERLIDESSGMEGLTKSRKIMDATCWKQHYVSLENMLKKRGQLFSHPQAGK